MLDGSGGKEIKNFKDTLNLPRTDFPIRSNPLVEDPKILERWQKEDLYRQTFESGDRKKSFILHDGPPYANGHIHLGHAYNKILKDIVAKSRRMIGYHVPVIPGWDCHGLPIELKVTQQQSDLSRHALLHACRDYAQSWIDIQRQEFKRLGVLMDWDRPYTTMSFSYEATVMRAFGKLITDGYIERKNKTVPWCYSCKTVLANAEIEYEDRKDPSIYVLFPLEQNAQKLIFPQVALDRAVNLLIWTTTPWTLPLNRAVLVHPEAVYELLDINGSLVLVAAQVADKICTELAVEKLVIASCKSSDFITHAARAHHPLMHKALVPIIADQSVSLQDGTAFVHCAPGVGPSDYEVGIKNNLEIYSPLSSDGRYTSDIEPKELAGMSVQDAQGWVIKTLLERERLLHKTSIRHSYPHCWRCRNGLIYRATKQWFCDLEKHNLKEKAADAIDSLQMLPEKSHNRFKSTLEGRLEWCLSRQRTWGVPIAALLCASCDWAYTNEEFIQLVASQVEKEGIEWWAQLALEQAVPVNLTCKSCGGTTFKKEEDILDVWFESGVSYYALLAEHPELEYPANVYLEGKDQHRAWFQSSLLTSMALKGSPCMKTILTHGYTVDAKGKKMSKSLGNVVAPSQIFEKIGTDGLRLWASSLEMSGEAIVSDVLIAHVQEVLRKVRNICRFLVSNLYDFDYAKNALPLDQLRMIDCYAVRDLFAHNYEIINNYIAYDFTAVFHHLADYASHLSSFYLDIIKDRLYVEKPNSAERRSAQTACYIIVDTLTRLIAPILSFTAEQVADHYKNNFMGGSVHMQQFNALGQVWDLMIKNDGGIVSSVQGLPDVNQENLELLAQNHAQVISFVARYPARWDWLRQLRSAFLKAIEQQRETGLIKHPREVRVTCYFANTASYAEQLKKFTTDLARTDEVLATFLQEFLVVSQVVVKNSNKGLEPSIHEGLFLHIECAKGTKCIRCWQWHEEVTSESLCDRCDWVTHSIAAR